MRIRFCPPRRRTSRRLAPNFRLLRRRRARKRDSRAIRARSSGTGGRVRRGSRRRAPATFVRPWTRRGARTATARRSTGSPRRFPPDASRRRSQIRGSRRARLRLRRKKASSSRVRPGDPREPRLFSRALVARARPPGRGWRRRRARRGRAAESPTYDIRVSHESRDPPKTPSPRERRKSRPTTTPTRRRFCTRRRRRLRRRSGTNRRRAFFRRLCAARTWRRSTRTARRPPRCRARRRRARRGPRRARRRLVLTTKDLSSRKSRSPRALKSAGPRRFLSCPSPLSRARLCSWRPRRSEVSRPEARPRRFDREPPRRAPAASRRAS